MNLAQLILDAVRTEVARALAGRDELRWGTVDAAGPPPTVLLSGDTVAITVPLVADHLTLTAGDRVVLGRVGSRWAILSVLVRSTP